MCGSKTALMWLPKTPSRPGLQEGWPESLHCMLSVDTTHAHLPPNATCSRIQRYVWHRKTLDCPLLTWGMGAGEGCFPAQVPIHCSYTGLCTADTSGFFCFLSGVPLNFLRTLIAWCNKNIQALTVYLVCGLCYYIGLNQTSYAQ